MIFRQEVTFLSCVRERPEQVWPFSSVYCWLMFLFFKAVLRRPAMHHIDPKIRHEMAIFTGKKIQSEAVISTINNRIRLSFFIFHHWFNLFKTYQIVTCCK